jgi:hypothetical protein
MIHSEYLQKEKENNIDKCFLQKKIHEAKTYHNPKSKPAKKENETLVMFLKINAKTTIKIP